MLCNVVVVEIESRWNLEELNCSWGSFSSSQTELHCASMRCDAWRVTKAETQPPKTSNGHAFAWLEYQPRRFVLFVYSANDTCISSTFLPPLAIMHWSSSLRKMRRDASPLPLMGYYNQSSNHRLFTAKCTQAIAQSIYLNKESEIKPNITRVV